MIQDSIAMTESKVVIYDLDSTREVTQLDTETIKQYKENPDFNYIESVETENWWTRFKKWIGQVFSRFFKWLFNVNEFTGFWKVFFTILPYIIVLAVLVLLVWLFMRVNPKELLLEKQTPPQVQLTEDEDIIQNQDIQLLIDKALQHKNYRLAIRYYYLSVLKNLSDTEYIIWESQKTNTDYIKELTDDAVKKQFRNITRLYDFIWYGSFEINEKSYHTAAQKFESLTNSLHR